MTKTRENGITLIALIITIIVMLILVGVTVNVALNGGLFSTTKSAAIETQIETDRETLQAGVVGALDKNELKILTAKVLEDNLPEGWNVTGENGGPYTATSPKENKFKVLSDGTIKEPSTGDLALLEEYCLGKVYTDVLDIDTFINNSVIENAEEDLKLISMSVDSNEGYAFIYAKYNKKAYRISVEIENETGICKNVELIYERQGREGDKVKWDSNNDGVEEEWIILYDNGGDVEMISMETMGSLTLGCYDTETQEPGDIDGDGTENTDIDKVIYSYNNAITRLNSYCDSLIANENKLSVRSVGSNPDDDPTSDNNTLYTSENLANWADGKYNGIGKSGDINYLQDLMRMQVLECNETGTSYWMASRSVGEEFNSVLWFYLWYIDEEGFFGGLEGLWFVKSDRAYAYEFSKPHSVRPVVKVSASNI